MAHDNLTNGRLTNTSQFWGYLTIIYHNALALLLENNSYLFTKWRQYKPIGAENEDKAGKQDCSFGEANVCNSV